MFCIAAFIVLGLIGIFSVRYRKLAKKAWACTARRITFRPCDTSFKEEAKSKLLSKVANKTPRLVKLADIGIEVGSFLLVILTIWSICSVLISGLNLFVWGTCNPNQGSSCSLSSETCSIDKATYSFWGYLGQGRPWQWFVDGFETLADTISNIPTRLKKFEATDYLPTNVSYYNHYDSSKPTALEIFDPGCSVCASLFKNIKSSGFDSKYNLAYIAYPIKDAFDDSQYKFQNSYVITQYLEAIKLNELDGLSIPADWQIIAKIFTEKDSDGTSFQLKLNSILSNEQTVELIHTWLKEIGYSGEQISIIDKTSTSNEVKNAINTSYELVNNKIKTVKIPTIIFNGRRHDGLVSIKNLE